MSLVSYGQGNSFDKIRYNGGTLQTKVKPDDWDNHLLVTSDEIKLQLKDGQVYKIDPRRVTALSYGQEAHRRVGAMIALGVLLTPLALFGLFHKTRLHFVSIEFTTEDDKKSALLLQADKDNYRAVLVALRGSTRAPISVADEDRKYVPATVDTIVADKGDKQKGGQPVKSSSMEAAGSVRFTSNPGGADIRVDGSFMGNTPAQVKLAQGKHTIQVTLDGYESWQREVEVSSGSDVTLSANLKKKSER